MRSFFNFETGSVIHFSEYTAQIMLEESFFIHLLISSIFVNEPAGSNRNKPDGDQAHRGLATPEKRDTHHTSAQGTVRVKLN
jgi:hypothetical protein